MGTGTAKEDGHIRSPRGQVWQCGRLMRSQLASLLGVSPSTVSRWRLRGCPRRDDGTYDLPVVAAWMRGGGMDVSRLPQAEIVSLCGITRATLGDWQRRGCPRNRDGTYDGPRVMAWRLAELERRIADARRLSALDAVRVRRGRLAAESAELDLAQRRGELLPRVAVIAGWVARYQTLRACMHGMLGRLGPRGLTAEQIAGVQAEIEQMLSHLADGHVALQMRPEEAEILRSMCGAGEAAAADETIGP